MINCKNVWLTAGRFFYFAQQIHKFKNERCVQRAPFPISLKHSNKV